MKNDSETNDTVPEIYRKIVLVGDCDTGKTSILDLYRFGTLPKTSISTAFDSILVGIDVEDKKVVCEIFDTGAHFETGKKLLSIICESTLEHAETRWLPEIRHYCDNAPIILVGAKNDLRLNKLNMITKSSEKPMDESFGLEAAARMQVPYMECSAIVNEGVKELMATAAHLALDHRKRRRKCSIF